MSLSEQYPAETIIMDGQRQVARIDAAIWPPIGAIVELVDPNRDAVVREVRLRLHPSSYASIVVRVRDLGETVPATRGGQ